MMPDFALISPTLWLWVGILAAICAAAGGLWMLDRWLDRIERGEWENDNPGSPWGME